MKPKRLKLASDVRHFLLSSFFFIQLFGVGKEEPLINGQSCCFLIKVMKLMATYPLLTIKMKVRCTARILDRIVPEPLPPFAAHDNIDDAALCLLHLSLPSPYSWLSINTDCCPSLRDCLLPQGGGSRSYSQASSDGSKNQSRSLPCSSRQAHLRSTGRTNGPEVDRTHTLDVAK